MKASSNAAAQKRVSFSTSVNAATQQEVSTSSNGTSERARSNVPLSRAVARSSQLVSFAGNAINTIVKNCSLKDKKAQQNKGITSMSFEEKTKLLVTEDAVQWSRFRRIVTEKGLVTHLGVAELLHRFVRIREIEFSAAMLDSSNDENKSELEKESYKPSLLHDFGSAAYQSVKNFIAAEGNERSFDSTESCKKKPSLAA